MKNSSKLILESINAINCFLIFVVIAYLLEPIVFNSLILFQIDSFIVESFSITLGIICRVIFYSGVYGFLIEIVSGQEIFYSFDRFKKNVGVFWKAYLLISLVVFIVNSFLYMLLSQRPIVFSAASSIVDILFLFSISFYIIDKKYSLKQYFSKGSLAYGIEKDILVSLFVMCAIKVFLGIIKVFLEQEMEYFLRAIIFVQQYLSLFIYLYISQVILSRCINLDVSEDAESKELYLICPMGPGFAGKLDRFRSACHPVFLVLRALTPKHYKIREFNCVSWNKRYFEKNKIVAITCTTSSCYRAYKIAKGFKESGSKVIMGGPHVTCFPDEALEFCDSVVIGDAHGVWEEVIRDYEDGSLENVYGSEGHLAYPASVHQEIMNASDEKARCFIESVRGCKFGCNFCAVPALCRGKTIAKPIHEIIEIIEKVQKTSKFITFIDNNIFSDPRQAKALFVAMKPLNVFWGANSSIDIALDDEVLALAKESGCLFLRIGYEMVSGDIDKGKFIHLKKYRELTKKISKKNIFIIGHFILGFDESIIKNCFEQIWFVFSTPIVNASLAFLTPVPGTPFYQNILKENRIRNLNWRKYDGSSIVIKYNRGHEGLLDIFYTIFSVFFIQKWFFCIFFIFLFVECLFLLFLYFPLFISRII